MINEQLAQKVLEAALETGGDFSEIFIEDTVTNRITGINCNIETASYSRAHGAGIRVLCGDNSSYAYTCDMTEDGLVKCARAAAAVLSDKQQAHPKTFEHKKYAMPQAIPFETVNNDRRVAMLVDAMKTAKAYSNEISQVVSTYLDVTRNIAIFNSDGLYAQDTQPRTRLVVNAVASNENDTQEGFIAPGYGMGFEAYESKINIEEVAKTAASTAVLMLHADDCPAAKVPVVISGGFGGVILHEACVHSLEATAVARGNSVFCGKLGTKIASDRVTAVDDGTLTGAWGTSSIDDEGHPTQRNVLIENGILKSYLVDTLGSRIMNHPITGSARRQDYTFSPTSRMNNTFFAGGTDDDDEMIKSLPEGLFATAMGGGSVNPFTGEFCFKVAKGYWIKNGIIVKPVKGATLVGKGEDILLKIDRVGKQEWLEPGMCGSLSGMVPTTVGQPQIRVSEMTVGGKGGAIE